MTDDHSVASTRPRCEMRTARVAGLGLTGAKPHGGRGGYSCCWRGKGELRLRDCGQAVGMLQGSGQEPVGCPAVALPESRRQGPLEHR